MDEWISKKDLLKEMSISYGQLYRWKREGLIPDSWFDKRSAFTGQETFLPRARVMERIRFILDNKDKYSFGEMAKLLSPEAGSRCYTAEMLMRFPDTMRPMMAMMELVGSDTLNHGQALCVLVAARALSACGGMADGELAALLKALRDWQEALDLFRMADGKLAILRAGGGLIPLYLHPESKIEVGEDAEIAFEMSMTDIPIKINKELNRIFEEDI